VECSQSQNKKPCPQARTLECPLCDQLLTRSNHLRTHLVKHYEMEVAKKVFSLYDPHKRQCSLCDWRPAANQSTTHLIFHFALQHDMLEKVAPKNVMEYVHRVRQSQQRRSRPIVSMQKAPQVASQQSEEESGQMGEPDDEMVTDVLEKVQSAANGAKAFTFKLECKNRKFTFVTKKSKEENVIVNGQCNTINRNLR